MNYDAYPLKIFSANMMLICQKKSMSDKMRIVICRSNMH